MVNTRLAETIDSLVPLDEHLATFRVWGILEMDIQEKDDKACKNGQSRARNGKDKVKSKPKNMVRPMHQNPTPESSPKPNPDIATIIAQQLLNILPQIVTQVTANVNNTNGENGNGGNNGCSYKTFTTCNPKKFDEKGGAVAIPVGEKR
ncbi:hypothetical protein Tco_1333384 [Tanacetum coccineum]